jgi:hypothetical protein
MMSRSLRLRDDESAPSIPADLLDALTSRFNRVARPAEARRSGFWARRFQGFLASPAFAGVTACLLLVGIAIPTLRPEAGHKETFRGSPSAQVDTLPILLVGSPSDFSSRIAQAGDIELSSIHMVAETDTYSFPGTKIVVNFHNGTIVAVDSEERVVHSLPLPADLGELSFAIGEAVSRL